MNKEELYDLIERYLDGTLPETEHQEVERRLMTDADFRAEVELHRALHTSLGDAGNLRLRAALDNLLSHPPLADDVPTPKPVPTLTVSFTWRRLTGIAAVLAAIGFFLWLWLAPDDETTRPISSQPAQNQPIDTLPPDSISLPIKSNPDKPIAMADPADFAPNPVLEARIGDVLRGDNGVTFELTSPPIAASFQLQNGQVTLPVRGRATGGTIPADQPLELLIYSNRPKDWNNKQPLATFPLALTPDGEGIYRLDFRPALRTRPGLYYIVAGQRRPGEDGDGHRVLWVGKFVVQEKK